MRKRLLCLLSLGLMVLTAGATFVADSASDVQTAWAAQTSGDVLCLVVGPIDMTGVTLGAANNANKFSFVGVTSDAALDFNRDAATEAGMNAMQYRGANLLVKNLLISDFTDNGAAIRLDSTVTRAVIEDCTFRNIGTTVHPPFRTPVDSSDDVCITQVIGAFNAANNVEVTRCTFEDCSTNEVSYSHVLYLAPLASIRVSNCTFTRTGNPMALASSAVTRIFRCTFSPSPCWDLIDLRYEDPYWVIVGDYPLMISGCTVTGRWNSLAVSGGRTNLPDGTQTIHGNNFSQATFSQTYSLVGGVTSWPSGIAP